MIVAHILAPLIPKGCPMATAPPFTFTLLWSNPILSIVYTAIFAKASLISKRSMWSLLSPVLSKSLLIAASGPRPNNSGATPTTA